MKYAVFVGMGALLCAVPVNAISVTKPSSIPVKPVYPVTAPSDVVVLAAMRIKVFPVVVITTL